MILAVLLKDTHTFTCLLGTEAPRQQVVLRCRLATIEPQSEQRLHYPVTSMLQAGFADTVLETPDAPVWGDLEGGHADTRVRHPFWQTRAVMRGTKRSGSPGDLTQRFIWWE